MKNIKLVLVFLFFYVVNTSWGLTGASYLIFAPDNFVSTLQPLAEWKTKKGIRAKIIPLSVSGNSASAIRNYIINAYNNWDIRPEYILLAGHGTVVPYAGISDDYYADLTGDYKIELSVGRLPATSVDQLANMVNKTIMYERFPYLEDSLWFKKGMTIIKEDYSGYPPTQYPDTEYWENARYCYTRWLENGYVHIDSFSKNRGNNATDVINGINNGRAYIVFRGQAVANWGSPFSVDPQSTNNGYKLPIVISATCATASLTYNDYQTNRFMVAGSVANPKGAVGTFGTTQTAVGSGLAQQRGTVAKCFHRALFNERIYAMGDAAKRAKFLLDSIQPPGYSQTRYSEWQLFGDPELQMWTDKPVRLTVSYDSVIPSIPQTFCVTVYQGSSPMGGVGVCLMKDSTIYEFRQTNNSGIATFLIQPQSTGIMLVTVTAHNCIPYEGEVRITSGGYQHDVGVEAIIEPSGSVALGANVTPKVRVRNYGMSMDSFPVTFCIGNVYTNTVYTTLSAQDTITVSFPTWLAQAGNYQVIAYSALANDQWRGNDTMRSNLVVVMPNDVGVEAIIYPESTVIINQVVTPRAIVKNYGSLPQSNFSVSCSIVGANGFLYYTNTQTINYLGSGNTITVNFANWVPNNAGRCSVKIKTNLAGDENPNNDQQVKIINVVMLMINEGFNSSNFPPTGWQAVIVSGSYNWQWTSQGDYPPCVPYEGAGMATYSSWFATPGSSARLITPLISVSGALRCSLKFMMMHDPGYSSSNDRVAVQVSYDGINFTTISTIGRYASTTGWNEHSVYLGEMTNNFYVAFQAVSEYGNNMFLDYVRLFSPNAIAEEKFTEIKETTRLELTEAIPNPIVNGATQIKFTLTKPTWTVMKVYDISGKVIKTLVNEYLNCGEYSISWDCRDFNQQKIAPGIYFYTLKTNDNQLKKKIVLLN